jgi:hypothetical protein
MANVLTFYWLLNFGKVVGLNDNANIQFSEQSLEDAANLFAQYIDDIWEYQDELERGDNVLRGLPSCIGDWNGDDGIDGDDAIQFMTDWDVTNADVNGDGGTDGDDILIWFNMYDNQLCY